MIKWLEIDGPSSVAVARRFARTVATAVGFPEVRTEEAVIVVSELATNIVKYAGSGRMLVQWMPHARGYRLAIVASDKGPGIGDVALMMTDRQSSGGSAGIGLGAVKRLSDRFDIHSTPGGGTIVACEFLAPGLGLHPSIELAGLFLAHPDEDISGDRWQAWETPHGLRLALIDGMGHGPQAAEAAGTIVDMLAGHAQLPPAEALGSVMRDYRNLRGGVASVADIDASRGEIGYANIGNIASMRFRPGEIKRFPTRNGFVGNRSAEPLAETAAAGTGDYLIFHSDGLKAVGADMLLPLNGHNCLLMAAWLLENGEVLKDDVTIVIARVRGRRAHAQSG